MGFWIIVIVMAAVVAATLLAPLLRGLGGGAEASPDVAIYKAQLAEVERDTERGIIAPEEAERTRTEIARRLLAADKAGVAALRDAPSGTSRIAAGLGAALVVGGGLWLYNGLGAPGYPDMPLASRLAFSEELRDSRISQAEAEQRVAALRLEATGSAEPALPAELPQDYLDMIAQLREVAPMRPGEIEGWALLALHEARLGRFAAAARAQEQVISLKGAEATVEDKIGLVDRLVAAAEGFVSPQVDAILNEVLEAEPDNTAARYYLGLLYSQTDRPDVAFRLWREIVEDPSAEDPHLSLARGQVEDAAFRAGVDYALPEARPLPGPSQQDIENSIDMSEEDRAAMIAGMVASLSNRLATEGGTADEWARLITALGVLGETERAAAIWAEAEAVFAGEAEAIETLTRAALRAGVLVE